MAIDGDEACFLSPPDLPGTPFSQPVFRLLLLVPVVYLLLEEPILVINSVTIGRHIRGGKGIEETGRQASQSAIPQRGIAFRLLHGIEVNAQICACLPVKRSEEHTSELQSH